MASFDDQVKAFAKKANMSVGKTIRGTSIALFRSVIKGWPVKSGRSRANWMVGMKTPSTATTDATDKQGNSTVSNMVQFINANREGTEFTLANNQPYAHVIEYGGYPGDGPNTVGGYSKQAPAGVVRINVARFEAILDEQARANR